MKWTRLKTILSKRLIKENHAVKKLSKYVTAFDYIDKSLIVLIVRSGGGSIIVFKSVFSLTTEKTKKLLSITRKKKRKSMIKFLYWLKVNWIALKY